MECTLVKFINDTGLEEWLMTGGRRNSTRLG